jgi:hypothetical protein
MENTQKKLKPVIGQPLKAISDGAYAISFDKEAIAKKRKKDIEREMKRQKRKDFCYKHRKILNFIGLVIFMVLIGLVAILIYKAVAKPYAPKASSAITSQPAAIATTQDRVADYLKGYGWIKDVNYTFNVNPALDKSSGGNGSFNTLPVKDAPAMVAFLKSTVAPAQAMSKDMVTDNHYVQTETTDPANWIAVQSLVSFTYPGNTLYKDGAISNASTARQGNIGDIFFVYMPPQSTTGNKVPYMVRGGCTNPQRLVPIPDKPVSSTPSKAPSSSSKPSSSSSSPSSSSGLDSKIGSQDPAAQSKAPTGGGTNVDPGPGVYTSPSDTQQPPVESRVNPDPPATNSTTSSTNSSSATAASSDATPPPPIESNAPTSSAPATGYSPAPGR